MLRKKESPIGVTNYFKKALHERLHKSDKRAGEILFNHFVVHAVFLKGGRAGGEKRRRCHTWPHEEVCYHFSWYILPTSSFSNNEDNDKRQEATSIFYQ